MAESIVRDGDTGRAVVASTGTLVDDILQAMEEGGQFESVLQRHPELTPEAVSAALRFARVAVARGGQFLLDPRQGVSEVRERPLHAFNAGTGGAGTLYADEAGEDGTQDFGFDRFESDGDALASARAQRERLAYDLDLIDGIIEGLEDAIAGDVIPHEEVFARLRERFRE